MLPDSSDPPKDKQAETRREGCGGNGGIRNTQTETDELQALQASLGKEAEEGGARERGREKGEKVIRDDEGVPSDGARFAQQGSNVEVPEPSATRKGGADQMGDACATSIVRRSIHSGHKSASGHAIPGDDDTFRIGRQNTQNGVDHPGVDALLEEPMRRIKNRSSARSQESLSCVKKARREEGGFEGVVPDPTVMNSGGFFR